MYDKTIADKISSLSRKIESLSYVRFEKHYYGINFTTLKSRGEDGSGTAYFSLFEIDHDVLTDLADDLNNAIKPILGKHIARYEKMVADLAAEMVALGEEKE